MMDVRSPLAWLGGKSQSAARILAAFPRASAYDVYVEPFGGAAHVLVRKPAGQHLEVYNDANGDLVNCWRWMRDQPEVLQERLNSLPYSRVLYEDYHHSLFDGTSLDSLERAVRWFYVLRNSFSATVQATRSGWSSGLKGHQSGPAHAFRSATALLPVVAERFRQVLLECRDGAEVIEQFASQRTLLYVDPPYIGCEHYYWRANGKPFARADHEHLATVLNATMSLVALSYYEHPALAEWYPEARWRRLRWESVKHSQRTRQHRDRAQEVLLCNYPAPQSLWELMEDEHGGACGARREVCV